MMVSDIEQNRLEEDRLLLNALADGELDAATALALETRLEKDAALKAEFERVSAAKAAMQRIGRPEVSDAFQRRIAALADAQPTARTEPAAPAARVVSGGWRNLAAAALVGAVLSGGGTYLVTAGNPPSSIEAAITDSHMRALLAASPVDVASSDRHTVKPWLDAKLGVSPPANDFADQGFALTGGRVDVINGRSVPTLVYRHREHLISLITLPAGAGVASTEPVALDVGGYHTVKWSGNGFSYWAVSDLEPAELAQFVKLYRSQS
jgi:anti-sigma factor RsiW